jgi:hypothetical protein
MDCETGEIVQQSSYFDVETGETIAIDDEIIKPHQCNGHRNRTKFTIPKSCLKQKNDKKHDKCYLSSTQETFSLTSKKKVIELKEVIITAKIYFYDVNISLHMRESLLFFIATLCFIFLNAIRKFPKLACMQKLTKLRSNAKMIFLLLTRFSLT